MSFEDYSSSESEGDDNEPYDPNSLDRGSLSKRAKSFLQENETYSQSMVSKNRKSQVMTESLLASLNPVQGQDNELDHDTKIN